MSLTETITADIATAMKAKDAARLTPLRMLKTALTTKSIEKGRALDPAEDLQVVAALVKQRRDSIEQFAAAGRARTGGRRSGRRSPFSRPISRRQRATTRSWRRSPTP